MLTNLDAKDKVKIKIEDLVLLTPSNLLRVSYLYTNIFNANGTDGWKLFSVRSVGALMLLESIKSNRLRKDDRTCNNKQKKQDRQSYM